MVYDINNAKLGDKIYGMLFEGLVEEYEICEPPYSDSKPNDLWIRGGGITASLSGDCMWFTTFEEAADYCAIYISQIFDEYRGSIGDIEDLIKFMYRNFIVSNDNRPQIKPFRKRIMRDVIREKAMYFGIDLGDFERGKG